MGKKKKSGKGKKGKGGKKSKGKKGKKGAAPEAPPPEKTVLPWEKDMWGWLTRNPDEREVVLRQFSLRYTEKAFHPVFEEQPWQSVLERTLPFVKTEPARSESLVGDAETMVKLLLLLIRNEGGKKEVPDDVHTVAASIRQQNGEENLRQMHVLLAKYVKGLDNGPDVAQLLTVVDSFDLRTLVWGPPYTDVPKRADLLDKLTELGWTCGDLHKQEFSNWAEQKSELTPHLASFLTSIQSVMTKFRAFGLGAMVKAANAGAAESAAGPDADETIDIRTATMDKLRTLNPSGELENEAKREGFCNLNNPIQALRSVATEEWDEMDPEEREEAFAAMKAHQKLFKHTKYRNFKLEPSVAKKLKMHRLVEDDITMLLQDDRALQIMWDSVDLNRNGKAGLVEAMSYMSRKYVGLVLNEPVKLAYCSTVKMMPAPEGDKSRKELTLPYFKQFLYRMLCYNRIYTTFGKLDSNESGQLDFAEWEKGAKVLGHELELKCTGSREEFDEIHQMRKGGGKSAKKGAGEGESAAYADTQVTFSDLCEWYQEKLTASATAEDEECGSNLGKHGTVLDSVWEPTEFHQDVVNFDSVDKLRDLVLHCHYTTRA